MKLNIARPEPDSTHPQLVLFVSSPETRSCTYRVANGMAAGYPALNRNRYSNEGSIRLGSRYLCPYEFVDGSL